MSREAAESLARWMNWLGPDAPDVQFEEALARWEHGGEPPQVPLTPELPHE